MGMGCGDCMCIAAFHSYMSLQHKRIMIVVTCVVLHQEICGGEGTPLFVQAYCHGLIGDLGHASCEIMLVVRQVAQSAS